MRLSEKIRWAAANGLVWTIIFTVPLGVAIGLVATADTNARWHKVTVERGLAMYCPLDGRWAWKGECD